MVIAPIKVTIIEPQVAPLKPLGIEDNT